MKREPNPLLLSRRRAIQQMAGAAVLASVPRVMSAAEPDTAALPVDPAPRFELSPYLYMQFVEPLGTTDGSVEAARDHRQDQWRKDVLDVTRELAPPMLRWGGIFTDYYRWREGVGPRSQRRPMLNLLWGGMESNQIGTVELLDFCRQVNAEPLICVNFESDGRQRYMKAKGSVRTADAREAAARVAYCNQSDHAERRAHGQAAPLPVKYWQLGNETSYDKQGFDLETAAAKTVEFARAMRQSDPGIQLIAWGDSGWAPRMREIAGEHVQFLAFHAMFNPDTKEPVLQGELYRRDPAATWDVLLKAWEVSDGRIRRMRDSLSGRAFPLAMTECHFAIPGRHRCDFHPQHRLLQGPGLGRRHRRRPVRGEILRHTRPVLHHPPRGLAEGRHPSRKLINPGTLIDPYSFSARCCALHRHPRRSPSYRRTRLRCSWPPPKFSAPRTRAVHPRPT